MSSDPAISINHVSKVYDLGLRGRTNSFAKILNERVRHPIRGSGAKRERFHALNDISFDVAEGEVVGVIGKNGAGKSTLLKILSRITPPSEGHIDMAGSVGSLLEVGTGFHPELTGIENVYLNGAILGMSKVEIDRRLDEIIDFAEVDQFLETPVKRYSSGMRVRLAFAVAAHLDPEILIIDEVLSVGDYSFQAKCLDKVRSIATDKGRTVLYVSHNLVTVEHLCPRSVLLVAGELAFDGPTEQTLSKYLNLFPRAASGSAPGVFDLAAGDRSRGGYQHQIFKRLEFRPNGGHPSDTIRMGDRLHIEIDVEDLEIGPETSVSLSFCTTNDVCLLRLTSRMLPLDVAHERRSTETIVVELPSLPFTPGTYHIHVGAHDLKTSELIDEVHSAAEFSVIPSDLLSTGYQYSPNDGQFTVPWEWELRPTDRDGAILATSADTGRQC